MVVKTGFFESWIGTSQWEWTHCIEKSWIQLIHWLFDISFLKHKVSVNRNLKSGCLTLYTLIKNGKLQIYYLLLINEIRIQCIIDWTIFQWLRTNMYMSVCVCLCWIHQWDYVINMRERVCVCVCVCVCVETHILIHRYSYQKVTMNVPTESLWMFASIHMCSYRQF